MHELADVKRLAEALLDKNPDPVPRFRLLRDVLCLSSQEALVVDCRQEAIQSKWVQELEHNQQPNGIWGRFHSQDSSTRRRFPTTEFAIRRALALGLDKDSVLLQKAIGYMVRHLQGRETWSDPPEKHEGWPVNIRFVTAGTLARVEKNHPSLGGIWASWAEIVSRVFQSGCYSADAERQVHRELNGISTKNKYMKLWMVYPLLILSSTSNHLPAELESALLNWLWHNPEGVYYVYGRRLDRFPEIRSRPFPHWLEALEVLSNFRQWPSIAGEAIAWIWEQQNMDGRWDFGSGASASDYFPLSDTWRRPLSRQIDCSTRILALLRKYYES